MEEQEIRVFGRYIVADPRICHGQLTFRGTRILVETVLDQIADGLPWDDIVASWRGKVTKDAIKESVLLAREVLLTSATDQEPAPASPSSATG